MGKQRISAIPVAVCIVAGLVALAVATGCATQSETVATPAPTTSKQQTVQEAPATKTIGGDPIPKRSGDE